MRSSPCLPDCKFIKTIEWIPGWGRLSCNLLYFMVCFSLFFKLIHLWLSHRETANSPQSILHPRTALGTDIRFCGNAVKWPFTPPLVPLSLPVDSLLISPWEDVSVVSWSQLKMSFEKSPSELIVLVIELVFSSSGTGLFPSASLCWLVSSLYTHALLLRYSWEICKQRLGTLLWSP